MIKIILSFLFVFALFFFGIFALREMSGKERWALTKLGIYSTICAVLTTVALTFFVLIF
jgi:hypothetical protein